MAPSGCLHAPGGGARAGAALRRWCGSHQVGRPQVQGRREVAGGPQPVAETATSTIVNEETCPSVTTMPPHQMIILNDL